ncbi:MAG: hypothetical protein U9N61_01385, partial [Euryarchaeota archaeon]|nr:hypothetical protein [Euryarchaeota archaeon]
SRFVSPGEDRTQPIGEKQHETNENKKSPWHGYRHHDGASGGVSSTRDGMLVRIARTYRYK